MNGFTAFLQLQKVDVAKREVWGTAAIEQPDRAREIMDYEKSLPNFLNWSRDMAKASGGLSQGNVRAMHRDVAAGKVIHFEPRDDTKSIYVGAKIVDDNEWKKVLEGVYTGFSVGGSYGEKWPDPVLKGITRYEAKPVEISLVDVPCMPGAQFEVVKADGTSEMRKLFSGDGENLEKGDFDGHPFRGNQYTEGEMNEMDDYEVPERRPASTLTEEQKKKKEQDRLRNKRLDAASVERRKRREEYYANRPVPPDPDYERELDNDRQLVEEEILKPKRQARAAKIGALRDQYLKDNDGSWDGLTEHLANNGYTQSEIDEAYNTLDSNYTHNRNVPDYVGTAVGMSEKEFNERETRKSEERQKQRDKKKSDFEAKRSSVRSKFINSKPSKPTGSAQEKALGMTEEEFNYLDQMGYVKPWGVTEEGMQELKSTRAARKKKNSKSVGVADLIKGAGMETNEVLEKLNASTDPAMKELAAELSKAFPPAKKEKDSEEESTPEGGDKKQSEKGKPFDAKKSKAEDAAAEGETVEHEESETDEEEAQEEATGEESDEQTAGTADTAETEKVRGIVIQLLEELGFVQEQGGQTGAPTVMKFAAVESLQKSLTDRESELQKAYDTILARQAEITGDLVKVANSVEAMEKRGGPAPVIRDLGELTRESAGDMQKVAILRDLIAKTSEPSAKQALQNELTVLEIKKVKPIQQ